MRKFKQKFPTQPTSKFKSKLEEDFNNYLVKQNIKFGYEDYKVSYLKPEKLSKYLFDFFKLKQKDKILDVGCGRGEFLDGFMKCGLDPYAVDQSDISKIN